MDSDSDEPSGELKKPRLSRPPDVRVPAAWSSQLARNSKSHVLYAPFADMFAGASAAKQTACEQFHIGKLSNDGQYSHKPLSVFCKIISSTDFYISYYVIQKRWQHPPLRWAVPPAAGPTERGYDAILPATLLVQTWTQNSTMKLTH